MSRINFHGLKFQLILVVKLFVICIGVACYLVFQRPWVESFIKEKYAPPPASLQEAIGQIRLRKSIENSYQEIPVDDRVYLYDYWMTTDPVDRQLPGELLKIDFDLFARRAERTLVSGSADQRKKALMFFQMGQNREVIPMLKKAHAWAERRELDSLSGDIIATIQEFDLEKLEGGNGR